MPDERMRPAAAVCSMTSAPGGENVLVDALRVR
jgi:hypothetical protein